MTDDEIDLIAETLAPVVKDLIATAESRLLLRIASQDAEIAALKNRHSAPETPLGFAGAIRNQDGHLIVSLTNGQLVDVGPVNGKDGSTPSAVDIEAMVFAAVIAEVAKIEPAPRGRDADAAAVAALMMPGLEASLRDFAALSIAALPLPKDGRDVDPDDLTRAVAVEVANQMAVIPPPKDGDPGKDAEPPAPELLRALVAEAVAKIPPPRDGESVEAAAVVALLKGEIEPGLRALTQDLVAALPLPRDGKDIDPVEMERTVAAEVARQLAALATPKDGEDASPEEIARAVAVEVDRVIPALITGEVGRAVAALPKALDGHTPTQDEILPLVARMVDVAVAALPAAKDGRDASLEDVAHAAAIEVERVVAALPPPEIEPLVARHVGLAVAALPPAEDGHTPTEDEIRPIVADLVASSVAAIPRAVDGQHGIGINDAMLDADGHLVLVMSDGQSKTLGRVRGTDGKRGASVMHGIVDADGILALHMSDGRIVPTGIVRGKDGNDGDPGKRGAPGRDAIEITIRSGIDETKSYAAGIYATWRGGVIGSVRQTDPVVEDDIAAAGWIVVQNGVAQEIVRDTDEGRTVERVAIYTNGQSFIHRTKTATPIYRGVWRDGRFERGDMVTHGGSLWHCDRDTDGAPEQSRDWTLAAKRGRDGKETVRLPQVPRGPVKL